MKKTLTLLVFFATATPAFAQVTATNFIDSFNRANLSPGGTPSSTYSSTSISNTTVGTSGSTTLQESVTVTGLNLLGTSTTTAAPYTTIPLSGYTLPFTDTLSSNIGVLTWTFNMRTSVASTGFASGSQEVAVILTGTSGTLSTAGNGYAVAFTTGSKIGIQLVKYTGGMQGTVTPIITPSSSTLSAATNYASVKVTYDPATNNWSLFVRDDGASAFADPSSGVTTQIGTTTTNNTYTGTAMSVAGFYSNYNVSASFLSTVTNTATFDNFTCTSPCNPPTAISATASSAAICSGQSLTLTGGAAGAATYSWSGPNGYSATAQNPSAFSVTTLSSGTYSFVATTALGCSRSATAAVAVYNTPVTITGTPTVCAGFATTLGNASTGGTWTSSNTTIATVAAATGVVTGITTGAATISYATPGCVSIATTSYTVNIQPAVITGTASVCAGAITTLSDATVSGTWTTSNNSIATVSTSGVVTGISTGTAIVTYALGSCTSTTNYIVNTQPAGITGTNSVCAGSTTTLNDLTGSGTWSSSNTGIASINTAGVVTGRSAGAANISYTLGSCIAATSYTVNTQPVSITGTNTVCAGATTTLNDATASGTWSSGNALIATVNTSGVVTGISAGTATISYILGTCSSVNTYTVNTQPAGITGTSLVCAGNTTTLSDLTLSGSWSSGNTAIATVNSSTGVVKGIANGTATITYTIGSCNATQTYTVNATPTAITGTSSTCMAATTTLSNGTPLGTWSSSNSAVASVNAATGVVSGLSGGTATISYSLTNACGTNIATDAVTVSIPGKWMGASSTGWSDAANWSCGSVPLATNDISIQAGTTFLPAVSTGSTVTMNSLTIASGASLTMNGTSVLNVTTNLTNNGTISGSGAVVLNGTTAQTLYGNGSISNLTISSNPGASINAGDTTKITGTLTLTSGTLTTNNGLVLASNATGTGRIGTITGGALSGNVTVQQYITGGRRAYRFMAHPFSSYIPLTQITQYVDITGTGGSTNGFTTTVSNAPSCYRYNPIYGNSAMGSDPGWIAFTNTSPSADSNKFNPSEGIRLFIRGAKSQGLTGSTYTPSSATMSMYGAVNTGSVAVTMHKGASSDYTVVGNPYPSPVDIGTIIYNAYTSGKVAGAAFYIWNPYIGTSGAFQAVPITASPYYIEGNTAVEVRTNTDGNTLSFAETNKASGISSALLRNGQQYLELQVTDTASNPWDMLYVKFNSDATAGDDNLLDATKPGNPDLNFYSLSTAHTKLSIDARPYNTGGTIPLGISSHYAQEFIIKAAALPAGADGPVYLHDKLLGNYVLLEEGTAYRFRITTDSATQGNDRFELSLSVPTEANVANTTKSMRMQLSPNPAKDEVSVSYVTTGMDKAAISIVNAAGTLVKATSQDMLPTGNTTVSLTDLPVGLYMVTLTCGNDKMVQKLIKE